MKLSNHDIGEPFLSEKNILHLLGEDALLQSRFCQLGSTDSSWRSDGRISCCVWQSCGAVTRPSRTFLLLLERLLRHLCLRHPGRRKSSKAGPGPLARSVARCPPSRLPAAGPLTASPQSTAWLTSSRSCRWTRRDHHGNWVTGEGEKICFCFETGESRSCFSHSGCRKRGSESNPLHKVSVIVHFTPSRTITQSFI